MNKENRTSYKWTRELLITIIFILLFGAVMTMSSIQKARVEFKADVQLEGIKLVDVSDKADYCWDKSFSPKTCPIPENIRISLFGSGPYDLLMLKSDNLNQLFAQGVFR